MSKFFIRSEKEGQPNTILIYDFIGESFWAEGVTAREIVAGLGGIGDEDVLVRINSVGGSTMDGTAIYNALSSHKGEVDIVIEGYSCSMATVIACAGKARMHESALCMTHCSSSVAIGNSASLREKADLLDKIDASLAKIYGRKSGMDPEKARAELMGDKDRWLDADEMSALGLVDEIIDPSPGSAVAVLTDKDQVGAVASLGIEGGAIMEKGMVPTAIRDRFKGLPGFAGFAVTGNALGAIMASMPADGSSGGDGGDDPAGGDNPSGDGGKSGGDGDNPSGDGGKSGGDGGKSGGDGGNSGGDGGNSDGDGGNSDGDGGNSDGDGDDPVAAERKRVADIMSMAKSNGMSADDDFVKDLIETGASIAQAGQMILAVAQRVNGRQSQSPALGGGDGNGAKGNFGWDKAIGEHNGKRT